MEQVMITKEQEENVLRAIRLNATLAVAVFEQINIGGVPHCVVSAESLVKILQGYGEVSFNAALRLAEGNYDKVFELLNRDNFSKGSQ